MNVKGNVMTISHFHDFYYLEALKAQISMAISRKPDLAFSRAVEKLSTDVDNALESITRSMALRIYVYLWHAALGEARHADENCDYGIEELDGNSRQSVYRNATSYFPNDENVELVKFIYSQEWISGGYGGEKWLAIVEAMDLFSKVTDGTFIDHTVDLEHNGGCVFDKNALEYTLLDTSKSHRIQHFLSYKFSSDILRDTSEYLSVIKVSRKVYSLVTRFSNIIEHVDAVDFLQPSLEWLSDFSVEWEYNTLTKVEVDGGFRCENCDYKVSEDYLYQSPNGEAYCEDCFHKYYTSCDGCGDTYSNDDITRTNDNCDYCNTCLLDKGYDLCNDCDEWTDDYVVSTDGETFCSNCKDNNVDLCEECCAYYTDILYHNAENHNETTESPVETENPQGVLVEKTFLNQDKMVTMKVYDFPQTGLFIFDTHKGKTKAKYYAVMTQCGLWTSKDGKLHSTIDILERIKDIIDWNTIQTKRDWFNLDTETLNKIRDEVKK